jgi:hypothetical protein
MKHTYLTVDLDYWYSRRVTGTGLDFIKQLFSLNRQMKVFTEHHLILRDIDRQYKKVINVDFHSDLVDRASGRVNCGTWANYFPGRQDAEFEWRYPNRCRCLVEGMGLCHPDEDEDGNECCDDCYDRTRNGNKFDPFYHPEFWTWKNVSRQQGVNGLDLKDVDKISFILSPTWSEPRVIEVILKILSNDKRVERGSKTVCRVINRMLKEGH